MLKVVLNSKEQIIEGQGNVVELCTDVGYLIKVIYEGSENKDCKEFFKESLKEFMNDEIFAMDYNELKKACKQKEEKNKEKQKQKQEDDKKEVLESAKKLIEKMKELGIL